MTKKTILMTMLFQLLFIGILPATETTVCVKTQSGYTLAGTLVTPDVQGSKQLVIMLTPPINVNRDYSGINKVLADSLKKNGIASFRFDNRVFTDSLYHYSTLEKSSFKDVAADALDVLKTLRSMPELSGYSMGFQGGSEGGIAALVAASNSDCDFCIAEATPTDDGFKLKYWQSISDYVNNFFGNSDVMLMTLNLMMLDTATGKIPLDRTRGYIKKLFDEGKLNSTQYNLLSEVLTSAIIQQNNKHQIDNLSYTFNDYAGKIKCPVFYVACRYDERIDGLKELAFFERIMFAHGNRNFNTAIIDSTHGFLSVPESLRLKHIYPPIQPKVEDLDMLGKQIHLDIEWLKKLTRRK